MSARDPAWVRERLGEVEAAIRRVVVGQSEAIRFTSLALLSGGHVLVEGVPGVAKTLLVRAFGAAVGLRFGRVQCTPDLMPSDIVGTPVFHPGEGRFRFHAGPLFTDLLLVDEINRAPAKTQAALLEAMQERYATVDGVRHPLGEWFMVLATQNPIEQEGTYPLPEAELDRFLFKIVMPYPDAEAERRILATHHEEDPVSESLPTACVPEDVAAAREIVRRVVVQPEIVDYAVSIARATRESPGIAVGVSPRAGLWLLRAAKANAALEGRDFVLPEDVQDVVHPTLRHRVILEAGAEVEGRSADDLLREVVRAVPVPH